MPDKLKRRWFQFNLRGLMAMVALASILFAIAGRSLYLHQMAVFHGKEGMRRAMLEHSSVLEGVTDAIAAAQHWELERRYARAAWRPWTVVDTSPPYIDREQLEQQARDLDAFVRRQKTGS